MSGPRIDLTLVLHNHQPVGNFGSVLEEAHRVSYRPMLDALGHPEWSTNSEDEYVARVVDLARDVGLRKTLRATQRSRMATSPLCDAAGLARHLEQAYFEMFARVEAD